MKTKHKSGFSLVEIMVATLVLAVLAVGGSAALYHTGAMIQNQEQKRMAVDQAVERLELVKRTKYDLITAEIPLDSTCFFVDDDEDDLLETGELLALSTVDGSRQFGMVTRIQRFSSASSAWSGYSESEYLRVTVVVPYDLAGQRVVLDTRIFADL